MDYSIPFSEVGHAILDVVESQIGPQHNSSYQRHPMVFIRENMKFELVDFPETENTHFMINKYLKLYFRENNEADDYKLLAELKCFVTAENEIWVFNKSIHERKNLPLDLYFPGKKSRGQGFLPNLSSEILGTMKSQ